MKLVSSVKRSHPGDDDDGVDSGLQPDDFTEFKSRYTKRRCRRNAQLSEQADQPDEQQSSGQQVLPEAISSRRGESRSRGRGRGGSSSRVGHQQKQQRRQEQHQQQHQQSSKTAGKPLASTDAIDAAIDSVISQSQPLQNQTQSQSISVKNFHALTAQVTALQKQVVELKQQVEHLLSIAGTNGSILVENENPVNNPSADGSQSYAAAVSRQLSAPLREAVLAAVHSDLRVKQSRSCNIVVSGMPTHDEFTDDEFFAELCTLEFGISPDIIRTVRLGNVSSDRLRPLLVVLHHEQVAKELLALAKHLRQSEDEYTSKCIFISPHQTRAERQVAYEARCRRRQQANVRQHSPAERTNHSTGQRPRGVRGDRSPAGAAGPATTACNPHGSSVGRSHAVRSTSINNSDYYNSARTLRTSGSPTVPAAAAEFDAGSVDDDLMLDGDGVVSDSAIARTLSSLRQSAAEFKPAGAELTIAPPDALSGSSSATGTEDAPCK